MYTTKDSTSTADYDYYHGFLPEDIRSDNTFQAVLYSLVFVFGLPGNILVLWVLIQYKGLKSMTDIYLLNLTISDLLFVVSIPFWLHYMLHEWVFGNVLCKVINAGYLIGFYSGILFIMLMSIERYLAIVHHVFAFKVRKVRYGIISSAIIWFVAICASLPELIFYNIKTVSGKTECSIFYPNTTISTWKVFGFFQVNIFGFLIPFSVMTFCYSRIIITLLGNKASKKHRAVKIIFTVMIVFFVFWIPYNIVLFLNSLLEMEILNKIGNEGRLQMALQITQSLAFTHCCVNPFIYAFMGEKFRMYVGRFFRNWFSPILVCMGWSNVHFNFQDNNSSVQSHSSGRHDLSTVM
ncbi:C-C chemokine receptor type 4-like [Callorhinchus milii]|uniref:C-C motif chemokine receptor 8 n=1 Tax=Callorhinchus milii TaxID=7868 RepID=A0A4W3J1A3_CALMI|nr:C-C chemokine receptor type 4-like [Callorhinchus milii]|eukprot:gi/632965691/ref/XP_007899017.1/ PREDICTED: C-C chemokine receptor type 4-like [Callorhinchus milii]